MDRRRRLHVPRTDSVFRPRRVGERPDQDAYAGEGRLTPASRQLLAYQAAAGALALAAVCSFFLLDSQSHSALVSLSQTPPLLVAREVITPFGKFGNLLLLLLLAGAYGRVFRKPHLAYASMYSALATCTAGAFALALKHTIVRARPYVPPDQVGELTSSYYQSFPSSDAACVVAAAVMMAHFYPRFRPALYAAAAAVTVTRVLRLAHWPSDVLAGAALGILGSITAFAWLRTRLPSQPSPAAPDES